MSIISVKNLSKVYKLYNNPKDRMKEALNPFRKKYHQDFYALKDINFDVKKGETVGIIGKNGSGKSTLLKILTGVLTPTSGAYSVNGKISSLLELGAGFNPELSGLENIYFNGSIIGYTKKEMDEKLEDILSFADIGEFVYQPVKSYSSGMYVRLAFAVAINVEPEVLIVDEALSVGDIRFQLKCFRKLKEIQDAGTTILFVTHDTGAVINYCSQAIWLHDGIIKDMGNPNDICKKYTSFMSYDMETVEGKKDNISSSSKKEITKISNYKNEKKIPWQSVEGCSSFGEGGAKITGVSLYFADSFEPVDVLEGGEEVVLALEVETFKDIENPIFGFIVTDIKGNHLFGTNNFLLDIKINKFSKKQNKLIFFKFNFPFLKNGKYNISIAVADGTQNNHIQEQWLHDCLIIDVFKDDLISKIGAILILKNIKFSIT